MARPLIYYAKRTWVSLIVLIVLSLATVLAYQRYAPTVYRLSYLSGWVLFGLILFLAAYNGRKKMPFLPLGGSEAWLQWHVYVGYLTLVVFGAHLQFHLPVSPLGHALTWLYLLVTLSGIFGLLLSRLFPKRLASMGTEAVLERIPILRRSLRERAEAAAVASTVDGQAPVVLEFYTRKLSPFFAGPRNSWLHVLEVRRPVNTLLREIDEVKRYLGQKESDIMGTLAGYVREKDALDYQHALQGMLKGWLFVHIPLTYALLLFTLVHIVIVYAFSGGAR